MEKIKSLYLALASAGLIVIGAIAGYSLKGQPNPKFRPIPAQYQSQKQADLENPVNTPIKPIKKQTLEQKAQAPKTQLSEIQLPIKSPLYPKEPAPTDLLPVSKEYKLPEEDKLSKDNGYLNNSQEPEETKKEKEYTNPIEILKFLSSIDDVVKTSNAIDKMTPNVAKALSEGINKSIENSWDNKQIHRTRLRRQRRFRR